MTIARRKGHTLVEVICVVAILVAVAAIGIPMIKPMQENSHDQAAADVVRARFSQLRSKAVTDNRSYCFEYQKNTGKFRCVPDVEDGMEDDHDPWEMKGDLPGEVKFTLEHDDDPPSKDGWTKVASFGPDSVKQYYKSLQFGNDAVVLHGAVKAEPK
jgi:prepilin-type N-terminal cleavage/methylation domain-containing protein